jgi:aldose 1-epimerase
MTCPPDAFNSGVDLITLQPGEQHRLHLVIAPIT